MRFKDIRGFRLDSIIARDDESYWKNNFESYQRLVYEV